MSDFDLQWKFEALRLAVLEQLDAQGYINTDKVFQRAKDIYNKGYEHRMDKWKTYWKPEEKKPVEKPVKKKSVTKANGYKTCPDCSESVPVLWKKHMYTASGEHCGHEFKEKK